MSYDPAITIDALKRLYGSSRMEDVAVEVEGDDTPDDTGDTIVIADTGGDGGGDHDMDVGLMLGEILATQKTILERQDAMESQLAGTAATADAAVDIAIDAVNAADEAAADAESAAVDAGEAAAEAEEEVIEPEREHRLWQKPLRFGRKDGAE